MAKFRKLNRFGLIGIIVLAIITFACLFALVFREEYYETDVASTNAVVINTVKVANNTLKLTGSLEDNKLNFSYHQIRIENDRVYIKLYSTKRKVKNSNKIDLSLTLEEGINKILIEGKTSDDVITIWESNT